MGETTDRRKTEMLNELYRTNQELYWKIVYSVRTIGIYMQMPNGPADEKLKQEQAVLRRLLKEAGIPED